MLSPGLRSFQYSMLKLWPFPTINSFVNPNCEQSVKASPEGTFKEIARNSTHPVSFCLTISFLWPPCLPYSNNQHLAGPNSSTRVIDVPTCHPQPLTDPFGRTDWQRFVSVSQYVSRGLQYFALQSSFNAYPPSLSCPTTWTAPSGPDLSFLRTFSTCNSFKPFCINSWISLSSITSLCSRNESLVLRFAYSLKLYAANCPPCLNNCRYWESLAKVHCDISVCWGRLHQQLDSSGKSSWEKLIALALTNDLAWNAASPFAPWTIDIFAGCGGWAELDFFLVKKFKLPKSNAHRYGKCRSRR